MKASIKTDAVPDEALMIQVRDGDDPAARRAFDRLVERHSAGLVQFVYRYVPDLEEASGLAQETFLEVYRTRAKYRPRAAFRTWLYTIARFRALNEKRRRSRAQAVSFSSGADETGSEAGAESLLARLRQIADARRTPEEEAVVREAIGCLRRVLDGFSDEAREIVMLHRFHGFKYHEIARVVDRPVGTVRATMHRLMKKLKEALEHGGGR